MANETQTLKQVSTELYLEAEKFCKDGKNLGQIEEKCKQILAKVGDLRFPTHVSRSAGLILG
jgi:hypothetical protein